MKTRARAKHNQGNCSNGCEKPCHTSGLCKKCYAALHYQRTVKKKRYPNGISKERVVPVGTTRKDSYGYKNIKVPKGRGTGTRSEWMKEHRFVMEEHLGRRLDPHENVHHINGKKDDNRLENLELWVTKQPKGQRPEDLVTYARWILEQYGNE